MFGNQNKRPHENNDGLAAKKQKLELNLSLSNIRYYKNEIHRILCQERISIHPNQVLYQLIKSNQYKTRHYLMTKKLLNLLNNQTEPVNLIHINQSISRKGLKGRF